MIQFISSKKKQARKPVENKEVMAYLMDIPVVLNDNGLSFKNNIKYV